MFATRQQFWFQAPVAPSGGFGNNALFPGNVDQYLGMTSTTALIDWRATTGYTLEYWIYLNSYSNSPNGGPGNHVALSQTNYWSFGPGNSDGTLELYYWTPGQTFVRTAAGAVSLNTWHNIAFTSQPGPNSGEKIITFYVDGVRQQISYQGNAFANEQIVTGGAISTGTPFEMGQHTQAGAPYRIDGYMDELRVSNIARYTGASYSLATSNFVDDANTLLLMHCDDVNGSTTFTDSSSFARTITNYNSVVTQTDANPIP